MAVSRREFLTTATVGLAGGALIAGPFECPASGSASPEIPLRLAPRLGQFSGHAPHGLEDEIHFLAGRGFEVVDDLPFLTRPQADRRRIVQSLDRHGLQLGAVQWTTEFRHPTFASKRSDVQAAVLAEFRSSLEVLGDAKPRFAVVVPGRSEPSSPHAHQIRRAAVPLRQCADAAARAGVTLLIEPLAAGRPHSVTTPMLADTFERAVELSRAVAHPNCRVLYDVYRQSTTMSPPRDMQALLAEIVAAWDRIGAIHLADVPGRKEPGSGTLDFGSLLVELRRRGFDGVIGLEHGLSRPGLEGEETALQAYESLRRV